MDPGRFASAADAYDHHVGRYGAQLAAGLIDVADPAGRVIPARLACADTSPLD